MRASLLTFLCMGLFSFFLSGDFGARAQSSPAGVQLAQTFVPDAPPPRRRAPRLRVLPYDDQGVYPRYNPGPDAVRECNATYVQEFRPSGTVIVPRMNCYWRRA